MSAYNEEFNKDNVVLRYIIVAMLAELKGKIYYYNQIDEDTSKKIDIPFYYSITGNERFLLDNFLYDTTAEGKAVGDYELVPRGIASLSTMAIQSANLTNKFVRSEFVKELNGELKTFSLMTAYLPVTLGFDITVVCSNNLEMLKVTEAIVSRLYKSQSFSVDLGMMRVEAAMVIPEDYSQERPFEYALNDKKEWKVTFSLEVQSFIPVFEYGIPYAEISKLVEGSSGKGIGVYRNGAIYFGNVMEKIHATVDDIRKSPDNGLLSNLNYTDPSTIDSGPVFNDAIIDSELNTEDGESQDYRNAEGEDDPGAQDNISD